MTGPFAKRGLAIVRNGYGIIPIRRGKKAPAMDEWERKYIRTEAQFEAAVAEFGGYGIGIVTKHTPAVDIDCMDARISAEMLQWCLDNLGPAPVRVGQAPKTLLLYAADSPFAKVQSAKFVDPAAPSVEHRLEVLGNGQQFVAYNIHPKTGKPFTWTQDGQNPADVPVLDLEVIGESQAVAACREFERLCERAGWTRVGEGSVGAQQATQDDDDALGEIDPPDESDDEIERVRTALKAMVPSSSTYDYDEWRNVLFALKWTQWECAESLAREWSETSEKHVTKTFNVVWRGAQKRERGREVTLGTLFAMAKKLGWEDPRKRPHSDSDDFERLMVAVEGLEFEPKAREAAQVILRDAAKVELSAISEGEILRAIRGQTGASLFDLRRELAAARKREREETEGYRQTHAGYADQLKDILTERTGVKPVATEGMIYTYSAEKRIWVGAQTHDFAVEASKRFDGQPNCERRADYTAIAQHLYSVLQAGNEDFFAGAPEGFGAGRTFYTISLDGEIRKEPLGPEHRQRYLCKYPPKVGPMPNFEKFIAEAFATPDGGVDSNQVRQLQEIIGSTVLRTMYKFQKSVMFYGPGRAGKGTMLRIIAQMFPQDSICAVSPFNFDREYYLANMSGKALNMVGELPDDVPIPAAAFKAVTGGDVITGRHPNHRPFNFVCHAAHIFTSNHLIFTKDHSSAFSARFILIHFANSRIGTKDIDLELADRIIESEMPAIIAWALQGAIRLHRRGRFVETEAHQKLMGTWMRQTNSMLEFVHDTDAVKFEARGEVYRTAFYAEYVKWCKECNRKPIGKHKLYAMMREELIEKLGLVMVFDARGVLKIRGITLVSDLWTVDDEL